MLRSDVVSVVRQAARAPSIHNTQPWRWTLRGDVLELSADRYRQLHVADRDGHSLLISYGAAAELTVLALRALGWTTRVDVLPETSDPDLIARFTVRGPGPADPEAAVLMQAAAGRRSERRVFEARPVPTAVIDRLRLVTASVGVFAHFPSRPEELLDLAVAVSHADRSQRTDPAYLAEMASWRHQDADDGIPRSVIPRVPTDQPRHTDIPLRDFEAGVAGGDLIAAGIDERPLIGVIFTTADQPVDRVNAGRAMMRLMVQAERDGIATCPLSQSVDLLSFRTRLRTLMDWTGHPQMMLRLGSRPLGAAPPLTRRRPTGDVLTMT